MNQGGQKPMKRRNFLKAGSYSILTKTISNPQLRSGIALFGFGPAPSSDSPQKIAMELVEIMEKQGTHKHPAEGYYYSGYGENLFTWEIFFDNIALLHAGDTNLGKNALRINLSLQREDGFIRRDLSFLTATGEDKVWQSYDVDEHAQPFLFQVALFLTRANGGDVSWITDEMYRGLKNYLLHWTTVWDRASNGLSEWARAPHSGQDNQLERVGLWRSYHCAGAHRNSFLYLVFLAGDKVTSRHVL